MNDANAFRENTAPASKGGLRRRRGKLWPALLFAGALTMLLWTSLKPLPSADPPPAAPVCDAQRSYSYLVKVCRIGPRISGSQGMSEQQRLIAEHFAGFKAQVRFQSFDAAHPLSGQPVRMSNMLVSWHPEATERVLLACHYDTRPVPDRDPNPGLARQGQFIGANDGASGVALFMELAHHMGAITPKLGVDFVFFDGEELVWGEQGKYFLGSEHFARQYRDEPPKHRYIYGVVVDMIADRDLQIYQELNSLKYAPDLTASIWNTAKRLNIREFIPKRKHEVRDDHLPLNEIAKIPTCDLIDFDYPAWHTTRDVPTACSGASLAKVGRVLLGWLQTVSAPPAREIR